MYTCLMPLFKWELAEVAMVEGVLRRRAGGRAGRPRERGAERRGEEARGAAQTPYSSPILGSDQSVF